MPTIYDRLGSRKLVFLCDEFDVLSESNARHIIQLRELHERLFIIPVVGRHISRLPNLISLLHEAPYHRIGFLDIENTKKNLSFVKNICSESLFSLMQNDAAVNQQQKY